MTTEYLLFINALALVVIIFIDWLAQHCSRDEEQ